MKVAYKLFLQHIFCKKDFPTLCSYKPKIIIPSKHAAALYLQHFVFLHFFGFAEDDITAICFIESNYGYVPKT